MKLATKMEHVSSEFRDLPGGAVIDMTMEVEEIAESVAHAVLGREVEPAAED